MSTPLPAIVARATNMTPSQTAPCSRSNGMIPSTTPCTDIVRMSDGNRLLPSARRFNPIARPISRFKVPFMPAPPFHATSNANRQRRNAVVSKQRHTAERDARQQRFNQPDANRHRQDAGGQRAGGRKSGKMSIGNTASVSRTAKSRSLMEAPCKITASGGPL